MVATSSVASRVLSGPSGELVLRVQGPGRLGQVVRLRSAKCSIGSGSRCTLRLDARGVRPIHCVLLRGAERTIIRRWAPDTRLNGSDFADAELRPGDRLSIGPVELEVLATGAAPCRQTPSKPSTVQAGRTDRDTDSEEADLKELRHTLGRQEQELKQEKSYWQAERERLQDQLQAQAEQLDVRAARLDREEALLQERHTQYEDKQAELTAQRERFEKEQAEWRQRQEAAEQALRQREETARQAADLSRDFAVEQAELTAQRERFEKEQAEWRQRQEAAEQALRQREEAARQAADLSRDFAVEQAELTAQRERFEKEQAEWRQRQEAAEQALQQQEESARQAADLAQGVAGEQAELAAAWTRLEKERAEWRDRQEAAGQALREQQDAIEQRQAELNQRAMEIQRGQEDLQLERETFQRHIAEEQSRRGREHAGPDDEYCQREAERNAQLDADADAEADAGAEHDLLDGAEASSEPDRVAAEEATEESPVDLAEVLRRLGKADLLRNGDEDATGEADNEPQQQKPATTQALRTTEAKPLTAPNKPASSLEAAHQDDEVSVEEYMSQLMQRVGGRTFQAPSPQQHATKNDRSAGKPAERDKDVTSAVPASRKSARRKPRGPAPEHTGFAAMRELANVSARSAVDQHARRQMVAISRSKLAVAVTATLAGVILLWLWTTHAPIGVTLLAAIISLAIAILWALQYAVVTGRLLIGRNGFLSLRRSGRTASAANVEADPAADPG